MTLLRFIHDIMLFDEDACVYYCFFFKQKTAYEMRISDWSSDVCSSDLSVSVKSKVKGEQEKFNAALGKMVRADPSLYLETDRETGQTILRGMGEQIGRASCRERVCQYV